MTQIGTPISRDRLVWLDYAKAIGIFLVVFAHASRSIGRTQGLSWSQSLQSVDGIIYAFHMPLFFLIAGYAASLQRAQPPVSFAKSLFWGVAVPYLVWSAIWIGLKVALPDAANVPLSLSDLGKILWQPVEHFWFLYHLFFIRLGWFAVKRSAGSNGAIPASLILAALAAWAALLTTRPELAWAAAFLLNFAIYGLGLERLPRFMDRWSEKPVPALLSLGALLVVCGLAIGGSHIAPLLYAIGGSLIIVGSAHALPPPSTWGWRAFAFLGEASLAIYVMHLIVGAAVRMALAKSGLLTEETLLVTATAAGLIMPAALYWAILSAARKIGPWLPKLCGLGPATRSAYVTLWPNLPVRQPLSSS
jgi:fucose 4-O-acetylase-like acetyltransferase